MSDTKGPEAVHGRMFGKALCAILGLDAMQVSALQVDVSHANLATVTATHLVTPEQAEGIKAEVSKYRLVPEDAIVTWPEERP